MARMIEIQVADRDDADLLHRAVTLGVLTLNMEQSLAIFEVLNYPKVSVSIYETFKSIPRPASNKDGFWALDRSHFIYDYDRIARETGYTTEQVRMYGVSYCRNHPERQD